MKHRTPRRKDLAKQRFGRLVVVRFFDAASGGHARWLCRCDCGREKVVRAAVLMKGDALSCGCYAAEQTAKRSTKPFNDIEFVDEVTVAILLPAIRDGEHVKTLIDVADLPLVNTRRWQTDGGKTRTRYAMSQERGTRKLVFMHNVIMAEALAAAPGLEVDHVSRDGLDNRRVNLRLATRLQNAMNRRRSALNTSGYKGVLWAKDMEMWRARLRHNHLGYYTTVEGAAHAYDTAAFEQFGAFAVLNFPEEVK